MPAKSMKKLLGSHQEFVKEFREKVKMTESQKPAGRDFVIREKEKLLAWLKTRIKEVLEAQKRVNSHYHEALMELEDKAAKMQAEIDKDKEHLQ